MSLVPIAGDATAGFEPTVLSRLPPDAEHLPFCFLTASTGVLSTSHQAPRMRIAVAPGNLLRGPPAKATAASAAAVPASSAAAMPHTSLGLVGSPHLPAAVTALVQDALAAGRPVPISMDVPEYREAEALSMMSSIVHAINNDDFNGLALCVSGRPGTGKTATVVSHI